MAVVELSTLGGPIKEAYEEQPDTNAFTDAEKAKLASLLTGATENSPDSFLLNRENHTGQQPIASVINLEAVLNTKASTAYIDGRIEAIIGSAPSNLDTLAEITAQLAQDESVVSGLITTIATKEPAIAAGIVGQYWAGDKSWQDLTAAAVGLNNVDNTSDVNKPVSTPQQTALNLKANLASPAFTGNPTAPTQTAGNNSTRLATTAFTTTAVANGVAGRLNKTANLNDVSDVNVARKNLNQGEVALTDATNIATNAALGNVFAVTLAGNRTLDNPSNLLNGATYLWKITQDATGSRTLAFGSAFKWAGGSVPLLSTASGAVDVLTAYSDGTYLYAALSKGFA